VTHLVAPLPRDPSPTASFARIVSVTNLAAAESRHHGRHRKILYIRWPPRVLSENHQEARVYRWTRRKTT
jgi:hypothetical protein